MRVNNVRLPPVLLERLTRFERLFVGFSGGMDSSVLLHVLLQNSALRARVIAVHVNHGIHSEADVWTEHCRFFCEQNNVPLLIESVGCKQNYNQEEAARTARYAVFDKLLTSRDVLLLGHHQDDQAETVLLQMSRGAGLSGLGAMRIERQRHAYTIIRPFLTWTKASIKNYATKHGLVYVEDESNFDTHYRRNYIRHELLPIWSRHWPAIQKQLSQIAFLSQDAQENLFELACLDYPLLKTNSSVLSLSHLTGISQRRMANVIWFWLKQQGLSPKNMVIFERVINELVVTSPEKSKKICFEKHDLWRYKNQLHMVHRETELPHQTIFWSDLSRPLQLPCGLGCLSLKKTVSDDLGFRLDGPVEVRFRQGGEIFFLHGQHKKLKKCFQEWSVPAWVRAKIPLIYLNKTLALVPEYGVSDHFKLGSGEEGMSLIWEPI